MRLPRLLPPALILALALTPARPDDLPPVTGVERQPLAAQATRVVEALDAVGAPLPDADKVALRAAANEKDNAKAVTAIQAVLDKHCLAVVRVDGKKMETRPGPARPE